MSRFCSPLVVPEVAQLSHRYTSITRGTAPPPRGSGIATQSRAQSLWAPSAPRAGSACGSCACCAGTALEPRATEAAAIQLSCRGGGAPLCGSGAGW